MTSEDSIAREARGIVLDNLQLPAGTVVDDDTDLVALGLDSMNAIAIILTLEATFGFSFEMAELNLDTFRTIGGIADLVRAKQPADA